MNSTVSANSLALRGLAALALVLGHLLLSAPYQMGVASPEHAPLLSRLLMFYFLVVEIFLLLSGCLLTLKYWERFDRATPARAIDRFILGRLKRIYPLHLLTTAAIGLYALAGVPHPISSGLQDVLFAHWEMTGLLNLLLMQGWGIVPVASWNEPSWTLSVLFLLYVLFPNLVIGLKRLPQTPRCYLLLVGAVLLGYYLLRQAVDFGSHSDGAGALVRGLVFFIAGMALGRLYQLGVARSWRWDNILAGSLLLLPGLAAIWHLAGPFDMLAFHLTLCLLLYALLQARGAIARAFANRFSRWLGAISFSLYLTHYPTMLGLGYVQGQTGLLSAVPLILAYGLSMAIVVAIAWVMHAFIDRPLQGLLAPKKRGADSPL